MDTHYDKNEVRAYIDPLGYSRRISISIFKRSARGGAETISVGESVAFRELTEADEFKHIPPALTIDKEVAQRLMDELWNCGIRPTEGAGSAGQLHAVNRHLEDMRSLVFKTNKPNTP